MSKARQPSYHRAKRFTQPSSWEQPDSIRYPYCQHPTLFTEDVPDMFTDTEKYWLAWNRLRGSVQRIAIQGYLHTGDVRLLMVLWDRFIQQAQQES